MKRIESEWNLEDAIIQTGRVAIVTGANTGLGFETALALARKGAKVVMACRNPQKAALAKEEMKRLCNQPDLVLMNLDLADLSSVRNFALDFLQRFDSLDLLINNAGVMMPPYRKTKDGFELQFGVNHLGHFALTGLLLPLLEKTTQSRVVSVSSWAHRWGDLNFDDAQFEKGYSRIRSYGQSKLACLIFAYELDRRLKQKKSETLSVASHPGGALTDLTRHLPKLVGWLAPLVCQTAEKAAGTTLCAALWDGIKGGEYIGPSGAGQRKGSPALVGSNQASKDSERARKLWDLSETLTGVFFLD